MCYNLYKLAYVLKRIIYLSCYLIISKVNVIYWKDMKNFFIKKKQLYMSSHQTWSTSALEFSYTKHILLKLTYINLNLQEIPPHFKEYVEN